MAPRYFHGGNRGLKVGEYVLPPSETGRVSASDTASNPEARKVHRNDRVYISTDLSEARRFASGQDDPTIYEVEPEGGIESDPDNTTGAAFTCLRATVVSIHKVPGKIIKKYKKEMMRSKGPQPTFPQLQPLRRPTWRKGWPLK
jgi:hypothetical protein